jgi:hypothetical protein
MREFNMTALISGIVFMVLGALFLFERLGVVDVAPRYIWPIVLVAIGVAILAGGGRRRHDHDHRHHDHDHDHRTPDEPPPAS